MTLPSIINKSFKEFTWGDTIELFWFDVQCMKTHTFKTFIPILINKQLWLWCYQRFIYGIFVLKMIFRVCLINRLKFYWACFLSGTFPWEV